MAISVGRKFVLHCLIFDTRHSSLCAFSVRRNASSNSHDELLLSDASSICFLGSSNKKSVQRKTAKATAVRSLLKEYGFTDAHISKLKRKVPHVLGYNPENNLSLKLKFLESIGFSRIDIPRSVLDSTYLLSASLEKKLIPCYNYLKNLPISEEQLKRILKCRPRTLTVNLEKTIVPNVELLRRMDVPSCILLRFLTREHNSICCSQELFRSSVNQSIKLGLNSSSKMFAYAVGVLCAVKKETWARKMAVYRGFGLSDDEILTAFRKQPMIMHISENKIVRGLEFFSKELGWAPATLATNPVLLLFSLERRVIPRCRVMYALRKKGLSNMSATLRFFIIGEENFLNKYILSYKDDSSELMEIFKGDSSQMGTLQGKTHKGNVNHKDV